MLMSPYVHNSNVDYSQELFIGNADPLVLVSKCQNEQHVY